MQKIDFNNTVATILLCVTFLFRKKTYLVFLKFQKNTSLSNIIKQNQVLTCS